MRDLLLVVETSVFIAELFLCLFSLIYPFAYFFQSGSFRSHFKGEKLSMISCKILFSLILILKSKMLCGFVTINPNIK